MSVPSAPEIGYPYYDDDVSTYPGVYLYARNLTGAPVLGVYWEIATSTNFTSQTIVYSDEVEDPPYDLSGYWEIIDYPYDRTQPELEYNKKYWWRAKAWNAEGDSAWETTRYFYTVKSNRTWGGILKRYDGDSWEEVAVGDFQIYTNNWKEIDPSHFKIWRDNEWFPIRMVTQEPETTALLSRMYTQPSSGLTTLINTTIKNLKDEGIWNKLDTIAFYTLPNPSDALLDWKNYRNHSNINGMRHQPGIGYDNSTNAANVYLNTNFYASTDASAWDVDGAVMGIWLADNSDGGNNRALMGCRLSSKYSTLIARTTTTLLGRINAPDGGLSTYGDWSYGLICVDRESSTGVRQYINGTQGSLINQPGNTLPGRALWVDIAQSYTVYGYTSDIFKNAFAGGHLTKTEHTAFYNILNNFNSNVSTYI